MCTVRRCIPILAAVATAVASPPAFAAGAAGTWDHPQSFPVGRGFDPVPRAAIAADGTSIVTWRSKSGRLMLTTGDPRGGFSAPHQIDRRGAVDWSAAALRDGRFLVAWEDSDGIRIATRSRAGGRISIRRAAASNGEEINGLQVAADPLGGWVVAERQFRRTSERLYHVRAMTLSAGGRLAGAVQELGPGEFGIDARPTMALAVDGTGRAVLAFRRESSLALETTPTVVVSTRPHGDTFAAPVALGGDTAADPRVAVGVEDADAGRAIVAATQVRSSGDAGAFGNPLVAGITPAGALGAPFGPFLANPKRAFGPSAALTTGGRSVLVFSLKTSSQPFETRAPVRAVAIAADGTLGTPQTLEAGRAKEPVVMPLAGGRALALWSGERGLGAALAGPSGVFHRTAEPKGPPPPPFHFNSTNRDLRTGGRYAIFAWSRDADGRVRIAVRRF